MERQPAVYLLASRFHGVIYTGVTAHLQRRIYQHKHHLVESFCQRYQVDRLVWYELHSDMYSAIIREKQLKNWKRDWKIELIEANNPAWEDLYPTILG